MRHKVGDHIQDSIGAVFETLSQRTAASSPGSLRPAARDPLHCQTRAAGCHAGAEACGASIACHAAQTAAMDVRADA